ncbi:hypothetical protein NKR23_g556 [Pleurostoma richardsiae]|uniref:Uncharacterized protein n=1 Tax=Pleurostoma richardsiae TaxID=41990 RepID=A0AA38S744_9PEZI|nr:hypothetical protein NKR23_g556 [Pleurostoma richardsiae]
MAAPNNNHPLPVPPGQTQEQYYPAVQPAPPQQLYQQSTHQLQQQQQQQLYQPTSQQRHRPRSRGFSFQSNKSQGSSAGSNKERLHETHGEKEAKRLHSKADPTLAMNEAEPSAVAATVKSSLASLRDMPQRDAFGNPIVDPDRSNPTRSRWERPLDTIRSFEAAIDGGYNRKSFIRSDTESVANWNRRGSYYGGNNNGGRFPTDSYYGGRPSSTIRPGGSAIDLRQDGGMNRESYNDPQGYGNGGYGNGHPGPSRQRYPRTASEPQFNNYRNGDANVYPVPNNHRSYETVASGSGSGTSAEAAGYQTDPTSSDNSSIERRQSPPKKPDPANDYGIGFNQTPEYQPSAFTVGFNGKQQPNGAYQNSGGPNGYPAAPPVPRKDGGGTILKKQPTHTSTSSAKRPDVGEKRKSWFARRFSKQS